MSNRYIVAIDGGTSSEEKEFIKFLNEYRFGWWHWIDNVWLITDHSEILDASEIRDAARDSFSRKSCLVIEINDDGDTWSGFGPKSEKNNMFSWLKKSWRSR